MRLLTTVSIILTFIILSASRCKKDLINPVDELPPETQTGANTFGCLVDGKVFIPKGNPLAGPVKKAQYQLVNGRQGFGVSGSYSDGNISKLVGIIGDSVKVTIGTFGLTSLSAGKFRGGYSYGDLTIIPPIQYETNEINLGELTITKFDTINQIVSGRFWFDAKNTNGQIVQIRSGRFDMPYVR